MGGAISKLYYVMCSPQQSKEKKPRGRKHHIYPILLCLHFELLPLSINSSLTVTDHGEWSCQFSVLFVCCDQSMVGRGGDASWQDHFCLIRDSRGDAGICLALETSLTIWLSIEHSCFLAYGQYVTRQSIRRLVSWNVHIVGQAPLTCVPELLNKLIPCSAFFSLSSKRHLRL